MKEWSFDIDEPLKIGLRRDYRLKSNSGLFTRMMNIEPTEYGAAPFSYIQIPWTPAQLNSVGIELNFPFPQLVRLKKYTLLLGSDYVFMVSEDDWTLTQLTTYDFHSQSDEKDIAQGSYWQYVDFWDTFVLTNGVCSIWYDRFTDKLLVEDTVRFTATTDYKGRAIFAGFDIEKHWSSAWSIYWASVGSSLVGNSPRELGPNWIKWTSVGRGLDTMIKADMSQLDLLRNDFGDMPMEDRSLICGVRKLGEKIVSYSNKEATLLSHKSSPNSTIGVDKYELCPGIRNVGALNGDRKNHIFVSSDDELWWIGENFQPILLGYKEYLSQMTGDVIVSHNESTGNYYIASQDKTYNMTWNRSKNQPQGFSEANQRITSCIYTGSYAYGMGTICNLDEEVIKWYIVSDEFDMGKTGDKSIRWITFFGNEGRLDETEGTIQARVHARSEYTKNFYQSSWRSINKKGSCHFPLVGKDFKLELRGYDFREVNIHRIEITVQHDDKRFTRGLNVNQINSGTNQ